MPLKIRIKPEGKFFAGGAVIKNVSKKPVDLLILSDSPVLREDYLMNIEKKDESDASNVYFLLQVIYLFKGKGQPLDELVVKTIQSFAVLYPKLATEVAEIIQHLEAGEPYKALKIGHRLLEAEAAPPPENGTSLASQPAA